MEEKNLKIDSFVKSCMQNTIGGSAKSNNQWYLELSLIHISEPTRH